MSLARAITVLECHLRLDAIESLLRLDAAKKTDVATPKPCGKGWAGTKPPGCTRAKKGESATETPAKKPASPKKQKPVAPSPSPAKSKTKPKKQVSAIDVERSAINPDFHSMFDMANGADPKNIAVSGEDMKLAREKFMPKTSDYVRNKIIRIQKENPDISLHEAHALAAWIGTNYAPMNKRMWAPKAEDFADPEYSQAVLATNVLASKALRKLEPITADNINRKAKNKGGSPFDPTQPLERHMRLSDGAMRALVKKYQDALDKGEEIREETFFATTYAPKSLGTAWVVKTSNFVYRIKPKLDGTGNGRYVDHFKNLANEDEVMYPPFTKFRVAGVKTEKPPDQFVSKILTPEQQKAFDTVDAVETAKAIFGSKWKAPYTQMMGAKPPTASDLKKMKTVADAIPGKDQIEYFSEKSQFKPSKTSKTIIELEEV